MTLFICESTIRQFHYHLQTKQKNGFPALCGKTDVMITQIPIETWGYRGHLHERYCEKCENINKDFFLGWERVIKEVCK